MTHSLSTQTPTPLATSLVTDEQGLLILLTHIKLEESLIDFLLEHNEIRQFTSSVVHRYANNQVTLTISEQVSGRQQRLQWLVYGNTKELANIVKELQTKYRGADCHYYLLPVNEAGVL